MDFKKAFSFMADDPKWFKKLLSVVWTMVIPVIGQFVISGYFLKVTKKVIEEGNDTLLPELEFKQDLKMGWKLFLLQLVYMLPFIVLLILVAIVFAIIGAIGGDAAAVLGILSGICLGLIGLAVVILVILMLPIATAELAVHGEVKAGLKFGEIFRKLKAAFGTWLLVFVGNYLAGQLLVLGLPIPLFHLFVGFYVSCVSQHFLGQAYNKANTPKVGEVIIQ